MSSKFKKILSLLIQSKIRFGKTKVLTFSPMSSHELVPIKFRLDKTELSNFYLRLGKVKIFLAISLESSHELVPIGSYVRSNKT